MSPILRESRLFCAVRRTVRTEEVDGVPPVLCDLAEFDRLARQRENGLSTVPDDAFERNVVADVEAWDFCSPLHGVVNISPIDQFLGAHNSPAGVNADLECGISALDVSCENLGKLG